MFRLRCIVNKDLCITRISESRGFASPCHTITLTLITAIGYVSPRTWPTTAITRSLCHSMPRPLHRQRAHCALANLNALRIGQSDSPDRVHCNASETLRRILLQRPINSLLRQCSFSTLNVFALSRSDGRLCFLHEDSLRMVSSCKTHFSWC